LRTIALVSSPAFAKEAAFVHDEAHLSSDDIAAATGAAPSTARAWAALKRIPSGTRAQRIAELSPAFAKIQIASLFPVEPQLLEGVGHMFWREQSERSAALVRDHALGSGLSVSLRRRRRRSRRARP
jgi:hypothetical protein